MKLAVRVTPKGGRDAIDGWGADADGRVHLKVRVSAAPSDGAANAAVLALLAKAFKRPRTAVRLLSGDTARVKMIEIEGVDEAALATVAGPRP